MKIMMLGLRGFPDVQGGVEAHAEHLCPRLAALGCAVTAIVRSPYMPVEKCASWRNVRFLRVWAPRSRGLEAIVHTFLGVLAAAWHRPDILHIQAIGPALMTPLARLFGLRVVVTHHGPDYDRQKWGAVARLALQLGERFGMRWSHRCIAISPVIRDLVRNKHGVDAALVPNGVSLPERPSTTATLQRFGLTPRRYVLLVSRLVPEKRHMDLLQAFAQAQLEGWKLVFVGAADHPDAYQQALIEAAQDAGAVMTGFQSGLALQELYAHSGLFVLPSSHEGLPIALLEALSFGLPVIASDIPANRAVGLSKDRYYPLGDTTVLAAAIRREAKEPRDAAAFEAERAWVSERFDWARVAAQTLRVYESVASPSDGQHPMP